MLPLFELRTIGSSVIFICFKRAWVIFLLPLPLSLSLSALAFKREVAFVSIQRILDHKPMSPNLYKHHRLCYRVICTPLATKTFIKCNSLSLHGTKIHTHTPNSIASSQVLRQQLAIFLSHKKLAIVFQLNQNHVINFHLSVGSVCASQAHSVCLFDYVQMGQQLNAERDECIF